MSTSASTGVDDRLEKLLVLVTRMDQRIGELERNGVGPRAEAPASLGSGFDISDEDFLRPTRWKPSQLATDVQRIDLLHRLDNHFLKVARERKRVFDVQLGESALQNMKEILRAMSAAYAAHETWDANLVTFLEERIGDLLGIKILNEDGDREAQLFRSLRKSKSLPDSFKPIYEEVKRFRRDRQVAGT